MGCSQSYCTTVTYFILKGSFISVQTCVHAFIPTCDTLPSMIANSVDLSFSELFNGMISSYLATSTTIMQNISWTAGFTELNAGLLGKIKS